MSENLTAVSYLVSAIFFILALKGLSHPESARNGNIMGIIDGHCCCNHTI